MANFLSVKVSCVFQEAATEDVLLPSRSLGTGEAGQPEMLCWLPPQRGTVVW